MSPYSGDMNIMNGIEYIVTWYSNTLLDLDLFLATWSDWSTKSAMKCSMNINDSVNMLVL